jgi:hypothetical protein
MEKKEKGIIELELKHLLDEMLGELKDIHVLMLEEVKTLHALLEKKS